MLRRVQQTIIERGLIRPGFKIVAGISGGADSTALLYALWFLQDRLKFRLYAAHLHHGLRGAEADLDARAVEMMCTRLNVPFTEKKESVRETRKLNGVSFEMAAREARQDFFLDVLKEYHADVVAVAHTRNDQAETVFMRILQGTGIEGLAGIQYRSEPVPGLPVIRPMLDVSRGMIEEFLNRHQLGWREDRTNRDQHYLRNKIRHAILPNIESLGFPHISQSLIRLAEIMREESAVISRHTPAMLKKCQSGKTDGSLNVDKIRKLSIAEQRRVIRLWFVSCGIGERMTDFSMIERTRRLLGQKEGHQHPISDVHQVVRKNGRLHCRKKDRESVSSTIEPTRLTIPGKTLIGQSGLLVSVKACRGFVRTKSKIGSFPATLYMKRETDRIPRLVLRSRREGDSMTPTGMNGRVTVKELMINAKVPAGERAAVPVLVCGKDVIWVAGYRVAANYAVAGPHSPAWKLVIERKKP